MDQTNTDGGAFAAPSDVGLVTGSEAPPSKACTSDDTNHLAEALAAAAAAPALTPVQSATLRRLLQVERAS